MAVRTLLADRPVSDAGDLLWLADPGARKGPRPLRDQLDQIAETLVAQLRSPARSHPSLTVAITGACGSGKSSALGVLRDLAKEKARAIGGAGAAGEASAARLVVCPFAAPAWQTAGLDARTSLVGAMLVSLAGSEIAAVTRLLNSAASIAPELGSASEPTDVVGQRLWASVTFNKIAAAIAPLRDVQGLLRQWLPDPIDGQPRAVAVLIDDLDRCDPVFVYRVLDELEQLHDLDAFHFLVAADPATLRRAIVEGGRATPYGAAPATPGAPPPARSAQSIDQELARLVQHTVTVPPLDKDTLATLLGGLFDASIAPADPFAQTLVDSVQLLLLGLPEPTPRALKRCLNFLAARIGEPTADVRELKLRVKRALLEHTWPDFFRDHFEPMTSNGPARNSAAIAMLQLTATRAAAVDGTDRRLSHELAYVCEAFPSIPWRDLPLALLRFLSAPPELSTAPAAPIERPASTAPAARALGSVRPEALTFAAPEITRIPGPPVRFAAPPPPPFFGAPAASPPATSARAASPPATSAPVTSAPSTKDNQGMEPDDFTDPAPSLASVDDAPVSPIDLVLDAALRDVLDRPRALARLDRAAQAFLDLSALGPAADAHALSLGKGLWPDLCAHPRDAVLLDRVLDRLVMILKEHAQYRSACGCLDDAYRAAPASLPIRQKYEVFLNGVAALQAARRVAAGEPVDLPAFLLDDPAQSLDLTSATARMKTLLAAASVPASARS